MRVSKVNELFKCRTLTAGQWSLTEWRGDAGERWSFVGEKRSRPERMERMAKVKCWGGKDKQGEKETERKRDKQRGMG